MQKDTYLLGAHQKELHRLGLQHQVWAKEAHLGWEKASFQNGNTILDLGCGPGFCSVELAYRTGDEGKVIAVDLSESFLEFLDHARQLHSLNIDLQNQDLHYLDLEPESLDGAFCRWVLAWVKNPTQIIQRVIQGLKPGATFVAHEYYAWEYFKFEPYRKNLQIGIQAAFESFLDARCNINIGSQLPKIFIDHGLEVISIRPMTKLCRPKDLSWTWPKNFLSSYIPKLAERGKLDKSTAGKAVTELLELEQLPEATCLCPTVVEVIAKKNI